MTFLKNIAVYLIVGLGMGFIATKFGLGQSIGFSPYIITIPAAFGSFFIGMFKPKKK